MHSHSHDETFGQDVFLNCMNHFGYSINQNGMCYGLSCMGMQAIILNDLDVFNQRLRKVQEINQLIEEGKALEALPVDVAAFFDGISLYYNPQKHADLFGDQTVKLQDWRLVAPMLSPDKLEAKGGLDQFGNFSGIYSLLDLKKMLSAFTAAFAQDSSEPIALQISSGKHNIALGFYPEKNEWCLVDANKLPPAIFSGKDLSKLTIQLVESLNFSDPIDFNAKIAMSVDLVSSKQNVVKRRTRFLALIDGDNAASTLWKSIHEVSETNPRLAAKGWDNMTWLHMAVKSGDLVQVEKILQTEAGRAVINGANVMAPLEIAVANQDAAMVSLLLQHGANPNLDLSMRKGVLPLLALAVASDNVDIAKQLILYGVDVNAAGSTHLLTPLSFAAGSERGNLSMIQLLLAAGGDPLISSPTLRALPHQLAKEGSDIFRLLKISYELALYKRDLNVNPKAADAAALLQSAYRLFTEHSKSKQMAAVSALQNVLAGKAPMDSLKPHEAVLNSGELKSIYNDCKPLWDVLPSLANTSSLVKSIR